jgi:hypothetical protein
MNAKGAHMTPQTRLPPTPAPSRKHRLRNGLLITAAAIVALIVLSAIGNAIGNAGQPAHTVTLSVQGSGTMDVTYSVGDTNSQDTAAASPWQASYQVTGDLPYAGITAQNGGSGSISCSITEDGQAVSSNTSYGAYAVVQCSH